MFPEVLIVPFKANAAHRHHIPKQRHRVTNSAAYDAALRQRGSGIAPFPWTVCRLADYGLAAAFCMLAS